MTEPANSPNRSPTLAPADLDKKYEASVKALYFELEQFWKRSLFFWGFIGAAFVAFAASNSHPSIQAALASFGFVCSVIWTLANRGSKFWFEEWERHLKVAQMDTTGPLYGTPAQDNAKDDLKRPFFERIGRSVWKGRRYSTSKLAIALSDYIAIFWFCILAYEFVSLLRGITITALCPPTKQVFAVIFVGLSFVFAVLLRWLCHTSND